MIATFVVTWVLLSASPVQPTVAQANPSVDEIVHSAFDLLEREDREGADYAIELEMVVTRLDDSAAATRTELRRYLVTRVDGIDNPVLVEKDGRAATAEEREKAAERERQERGEGDSTEVIHFDEELMSRYDMVLGEGDQIDGRATWPIEFKPKARRLPTRRKMDRFLNRLAGRIWVDVATGEMVRAQFRLVDSVKLWGGLLGSITQLEGQFDRAPMADGRWMPSRFEALMNGRVVFKSLHQRQKLVWHGYRALPMADQNPQDDAASATGASPPKL